ncbi:MAG: hypothetical protein KAT05_04540 [Spirochaetes bacterium]|nr:hypothetical protein [Spirochaetota bacterium]
MIDFLKLIQPLNLINSLYEQFTPVISYDIKNKNVDFLSELESGEIEADIKKSMLIRHYVLKVPCGCSILNDENIIFLRKTDITKGEDYILIPNNQIPKHLQVSKFKFRYSLKINKKNMSDLLYIEEKENVRTIQEYQGGGSITVTNLSDYNISNLIITKKIEVPSRIELENIEFKILPDNAYDNRIVDRGLVGRINTNSKSADKIKRVLILELSLDLKPNDKETFNIFYKFLN